MKLIIKIGSNILTTNDSKLDLNNLRNLCNQIAIIKQKGISVIIVTSGSIVCGAERLQLKPLSIQEKQASASVGQNLLLNEYNKFLEMKGIAVGQILLTKDGLENKNRVENAKNTIYKLLELGAIPIINENDTIAVEEIRFGDNDMLSAMVAVLVNADKLLMLTDIDGLYDKNPNLDKSAKLIETVKNIDQKIEKIAGDAVSYKGTGGMVTKIQAAKLATENGIETIIANGRTENIITNIIFGKQKCLSSKFIAKKEQKNG